MSHGVKAVKYIGVADIRRITSDDWGAVGVRGQASTSWTSANGFTVLGEHLNASAIDYFKDDDDFVMLYEESTA